jgi:hypothetical protein
MSISGYLAPGFWGDSCEDVNISGLRKSIPCIDRNVLGVKGGWKGTKGK